MSGGWRVKGRDVGSQGLDEGQVGQRQRTLFVAVADQGLAASEGDVGGELLRDGRLPDPRLPHHHHQAALAGEGVIEGTVELGHL